MRFNAEIRQIYPSADIVGKYTVFNIKGNNYRLIAEINYRSQTIFVRYILTHSEYDKNKWKA
jgi:mRNA interferase HigB